MSELLPGTGNIPIPEVKASPFRRPSFILSLVGILAFALCVRLANPFFHYFLDVDEADYASSMQGGFFRTYFGIKETTGWEFLHETITELRTTGEAHPWRTAHLKGDPSALRHLHPPLGLYPLAVLATFQVRDERILRIVPLGIGLLACLACGWLAFQLALGLAPRARWTAFYAAAGLMAASSFHAIISTNLSFHSAYNLFAIVCLGLAVRAAQSGSLKTWYASCALLAAAVLTIPYWVLLVPGTAISLWYCLRNPEAPGKLIPAGFFPSALRGLGVMIVTFTVLWPPFLWTLSFLKTILIYVGMIINPLPSSGFLPWPLALAKLHPALVILLIAAIAGIRYFPKQGLRYTLPLLAYLAAFCILNLRVVHMKELYASHIVPILAALAAVLSQPLLERLSQTGRRMALGAFAAALAVQPVLAHHHAEKLAEWRPAMKELQDRAVGKTVLALSNHGAFAYYLTGANVHFTPTSPKDSLEKAGQLLEGKFDWILQQSPRLIPDPKPAVSAPESYRLQTPSPLGNTYIYIWEKSP